MLGFTSSIGSAGVPAWHELINGPEERKLAWLADSQWRARARHDWDHQDAAPCTFNPELLPAFMLIDSENGHGPVGISLLALAEQRGLHPSDALADWVLDNGIGSRCRIDFMGAGIEGIRTADSVKDSAEDPYAIMGGTDAGAHLTMFCGAGGGLYLLTHWARDEKLLSIEQAVHCLTGKSASFFSLHDRGVIEVGRRGDLAVFALDEIETRPYQRVYDLPDGKYRLTRPAAGFRATIVGGVPTSLNGESTGEYPTTFGNARAAAGASVV
jgi:N-acyl-D-aspartate/D-glutamate deacylase